MKIHLIVVSLFAVSLSTLVVNAAKDTFSVLECADHVTVQEALIATMQSKLETQTMRICPIRTELLGPYTATSNFVDDIAGTVDERPDTWGKAGVAEHVLTFHPPDGYRVRIISIRGGFVLWPTTNGIGPAISPDGTFMGALSSVLTSRPGGSTRADFLADNALFYVQLATERRAVRAVIEVGFVGVKNTLLPEDHKLRFFHAVWLNDTGLKAHMETTISQIIYQFERK